MNLLAFIPLIIFLIILVGLGSIPGIIAKRKNRSKALWWVSGTFAFPIALINVLCFADLETIPEDRKSSSLLKEKIILTCCIAAFVLMIASRIQSTYH